MPNQSPSAEIVDNSAFEAESNNGILPNALGRSAMPPAVKERYHREKNSNQLVIPRYAYEEDTVELSEDGSDLLA